MASIQEIRNLVDSFVSGKIPFAELAERFLPLLRPSLSSADKDLGEFALAVHSQVSQHAHGVFSDQQLQNNLILLLEQRKSMPGPNQILMFHASAVLPGVNQLMVEKMASPAAPVFAGTSREGVFSSAIPLPG